MEKDRIVGVLREARGIRKNKTGNKVANAKPSARDKAEKIAGKGQNALGANVLGQKVLGQKVLGQKVLGPNALGQNTLGQTKDASRGPAKEADRR
jgi:uncharacterized protein YjbJ (UPF0337 family)